LQPVFGTLFHEPFKQESVGAMRAFNGDIAERFGQFRGTTGVVHMAMRQQDAVYGNARFGNGAFNLRDIAARVYHHAVLGILIPDQGAVLLEGCDGDDGGGKGHGQRLARTAAKVKPALFDLETRFADQLLFEGAPREILRANRSAPAKRVEDSATAYVFLRHFPSVARTQAVA
jgi:hypothetical protein